MKTKAAVLIPAFQPDSRLVKLVCELKFKNIDVIVVDDGNVVCQAIFDKIRSIGGNVIAHKKTMTRAKQLKQV